MRSNCKTSAQPRSHPAATDILHRRGEQEFETQPTDTDLEKMVVLYHCGYSTAFFSGDDGHLSTGRPSGGFHPVCQPILAVADYLHWANNRTGTDNTQQTQDPPYGTRGQHACRRMGKY